MEREDVLIEALPYIREFHGSIIVIKLGGHVIDDFSIMDQVAKDIVLLRYVGIRPVVVHGGGAEISQLMEKMGKEPKFVKGLRVTDEETLQIASMVLLGSVNQKFVSLIGKHGASGLGLSGEDVNLIVARKRSPVKIQRKEIDLGLVGEVEKVNPEILLVSSEKGYIPVIAPIAVDSAGNTLNVNADEIAGCIAATINAKKLLILTDVDGILRDPSNPSSLISSLSLEEAKELLRRKIVKSGMIPKIEACIHALQHGVERAHIISGTRAHSILLEIFTKSGIGTMLYEK